MAGNPGIRMSDQTRSQLEANAGRNQSLRLTTPGSNDQTQTGAKEL